MDEGDVPVSVEDPTRNPQKLHPTLPVSVRPELCERRSKARRSFTEYLQPPEVDPAKFIQVGRSMVVLKTSLRLTEAKRESHTRIAFDQARNVA